MAPPPGTEIAAGLAARHFGVDGEATALPGEIDANFVIRAGGELYVLRVTPPDADPAGLDLQNAVMTHLAGRELALTTPVPLTARDGSLTAATPHGPTRLLTWVAGSPYGELAPRDRDPADVGRAVSLLVDGLASFPQSKVAGRREWDLATAAETMAAGLGAIEDPFRRDIVARGVADHLNEVAPLWEALPHQQIHNDINDLNLLVDGAGAVTGLIDFGDTVFSARIGELAVAAAYLMLDTEDPIAVAAEMVAAAAATVALEPAEAAVLVPMIRSRLALSVVMSAGRANSGNPHHTVSEADAWDLLERLDAADDAAVRGELAAAAGHPVPGRSLQRDLRRRRTAALLPSLSLHYHDPLIIVRGAGTHLYDERARRYLDCVNNVAHVGHGNAAVTAAASRQTRLLNTNTRYLHPLVLEYAERLAATLPDPLEVVALVNSGSEANELAIRMARAHRDSEAVAVFASGYHGNTAATVAVSHYKFAGPGGAGAPDWVRVLPLPDPYRSGYTGWGAAKAYAAAAEAVLGREPLAGLIAESIIGCGGQIVPADGVLAAAYDAARTAGAVCIADEVQVGFGRVGRAFWGFELHGVTPDIVTMGKPIGNGHPLGAVVTTREIAASFDNGMEYFNTFGGNPVSAAVGLAVLDEIERHGLQEHALDVGTYLEEELLSLADRHKAIGDIRGSGLFLGVELVTDRRSREPAADLTHAVVESARHAGVLLSIDGPHHNVIKIKPPLVFTHDDANTLVAALDAALRSLGRG